MNRLLIWPGSPRDTTEIEEIMDSLKELREEEEAELSAAPNGGPASPFGNSGVSEGPPSVS